MIAPVDPTQRLLEKIGQLQEENVGLRAEKERIRPELEGQIFNLMRENRQRVEGFQNQVAELGRTLADQQANGQRVAAVARERIAGLEGQLREKEEANRELQDRVALLGRTLEDQRANGQRVENVAQARIGELEGQLGEKEEANQELQGRVALLGRTLEDQRADGQRIAEVAQARIAELEGQLGEKERANQELRDRAAERQRAIADLEQRWDDQHQRYDVAIQENRQFQGQIAEFESIGVRKKGQDDEPITDLEEQLRNHEERNEPVTQENRQFQAKVAELEELRVWQTAREQQLNYLNGEKDERIAALEAESQNRLQEKEAAIRLSQQFQARAEQLERLTVNLRATIEQGAVRGDGLLFEARRINREMRDQLRQHNELHNENNVQMANLQEQLIRKMREKEQLLNQIDDLEHQAEVNENGLRDLQNRLNVTNQRIQHLNGQIVQERTHVRKAIELSDLYIRFYRTKEKVKALKDCQAASVICGRIFFALIGAIVGTLGLLIGILAGGEAMGTTAHLLNASRVRNLESERKRLRDRIGEIHGLLAIGPISSELYDSAWKIFRYGH